MKPIPTSLKRAALLAVVAAGAIGAAVTPASAHRYETRCDRDGDDCYTVRCDNDGDDCARVHRYRGYYGYHGYYGSGGSYPGYSLGLSFGNGYYGDGYYGGYYGNRENEEDEDE